MCRKTTKDLLIPTNVSTQPEGISQESLEPKTCRLISTELHKKLNELMDLTMDDREHLLTHRDELNLIGRAAYDR